MCGCFCAWVLVCVSVPAHITVLPPNQRHGCHDLCNRSIGLDQAHRLQNSCTQQRVICHQHPRILDGLVIWVVAEDLVNNAVAAISIHCNHGDKPNCDIPCTLPNTSINYPKCRLCAMVRRFEFGIARVVQISFALVCTYLSPIWDRGDTLKVKGG